MNISLVFLGIIVAAYLTFAVYCLISGILREEEE